MIIMTSKNGWALANRVGELGTQPNWQNTYLMNTVFWVPSPALTIWKQEDRELKSITTARSKKFKTGLGYKKPRLKQGKAQKTRQVSL